MSPEPGAYLTEFTGALAPASATSYASPVQVPFRRSGGRDNREAGARLLSARSESGAIPALPPQRWVGAGVSLHATVSMLTGRRHVRSPRVRRPAWTMQETPRAADSQAAPSPERTIPVRCFLVRSNRTRGGRVPSQGGETALKAISMTVAAGLDAAGALAAEPGSPDSATADPVVVTATRTPEPLSATIRPVELIPAEVIQRSGQDSFTELLQQQANVEIAANGGAGRPAASSCAARTAATPWCCWTASA